MTDIDLDAALAVAVDAAKSAGALIAGAWGSRAKNVVAKSSHVDLVTETDKKCEQVIRDALLAAYPGHKFIGEEEAAEAGGAVHLTDDPTWMVRARPGVGVDQGLAAMLATDRRRAPWPQVRGGACDARLPAAGARRARPLCSVVRVAARALRTLPPKPRPHAPSNA